MVGDGVAGPAGPLQRCKGCHFNRRLQSHRSAQCSPHIPIPIPSWDYPQHSSSHQTQHGLPLLSSATQAACIQTSGCLADDWYVPAIPLEAKHHSHPHPLHSSHPGPSPLALDVSLPALKEGVFAASRHARVQPAVVVTHQDPRVSAGRRLRESGSGRGQARPCRCRAGTRTPGRGSAWHSLRTTGPGETQAAGDNEPGDRKSHRLPQPDGSEERSIPLSFFFHSSAALGLVRISFSR